MPMPIAVQRYERLEHLASEIVEGLPGIASKTVERIRTLRQPTSKSQAAVPGKPSGEVGSTSTKEASMGVSSSMMAADDDGTESKGEKTVSSGNYFAAPRCVGEV